MTDVGLIDVLIEGHCSYDEHGRLQQQPRPHTEATLLEALPRGQARWACAGAQPAKQQGAAVFGASQARARALRASQAGSLEGLVEDETQVVCRLRRQLVQLLLRRCLLLVDGSQALRGGATRNGGWEVGWGGACGTKQRAQPHKAFSSCLLHTHNTVQSCLQTSKLGGVPRRRWAQ